MTDTIKAESTDSAHESSMPALKGVPDGPLLQGEIDPLRHYLAGISRYTLLTREEEEALTKAYYETGDPELASRLITSNLRLVIKIALDFQKLWMQNFLDLIQEGNIGLMQAVRKFDPYRGVKFSYYASFWIKAYILKFIMDNWRLVKIGTTQAQRKLFYNLHKEKDRLYALGYDPVPKLIWDVSLDAPVKEDSEDRNMDFVSSTEDLIEARVARREIRIHLRDHLAAFKDGLEGKERIIFEERMLTDEPRTLQDLGQVFGISRERVRQIESRLKKKLKRFLQDRIPDIQSYPEGIEEA
jgi:RNA polymerase sigma-32 factor